MKMHMEKYKHDLEKSIGEYMEKPISERSAAAIKSMMECWMMLDGKDEYGSAFSAKDAECWNKGMVNVDGSKGGHWTVDQTTAVASSVGVKFEHLDANDWNVAMNMMWSDYHGVAQKYSVDSPGFYAEMAKAFLFDPDGGKPYEKLGAYYNYIVKPNAKW